MVWREHRIVLYLFLFSGVKCMKHIGAEDVNVLDRESILHNLDAIQRNTRAGLF